MTLLSVVKAGRLANGAERGKGKVVHLIWDGRQWGGEALCGERPKIMWTEREGAEPTCPKCKRKLEGILRATEVNDGLK